MRPGGLLVGGGEDGPALARALVEKGLAGGAKEVVVMTAITLVEAVEYIRNDEAHSAALVALQEVREVLDSTSKRCLPDGPCWCKSYLPTLGHMEDCQRARALLEKLIVK